MCKVGGKKYALFGPAKTVRGLGPPVPPRDAEVIVAYDGRGVRTHQFDQEPGSLVHYLTRALKVADGRAVFMASEVGDEALFRAMRLNPGWSYIARRVESKADLAQKLAGATGKNLRALLHRLARAPGPGDGRSAFLEHRNAADADRPAGYVRPLRKRNARAQVTRWTAGGYREVQRALRTGRPVPAGNKDARRLLAALRRYMATHALRAPAMPPKVRNLDTGSEAPYLYRGVGMSRAGLHQMVKQGFHEDPGYMSFSRDKSATESFPWANDTDVVSTEKVVFRLNVRDVPRGTPWIWFYGHIGGNAAKAAEFGYPVKPGNHGDPVLSLRRHRNWNASVTEEEHEVLLPPGKLRVKGKPSWERNGVCVNVAYAADT